MAETERAQGSTRIAFELVRDARGSLVHVRRRDDGECIGCIEVGLFEIVKAHVLEEERRRERDGDGVRR